MITRCQGMLIAPPPPSLLREHLRSLIDSIATIKFQQQESTDRTTLAVSELQIGEFLNKLADMIRKATTHHFFAKNKDIGEIRRKLCNQMNVYYKRTTHRIIHDCATRMFFNAPSQTLCNLFCILSTSTEKLRLIPCVFSDYLNHDAVSVNSFLKSVLIYVKSISPDVDT